MVINQNNKISNSKFTVLTAIFGNYDIIREPETIYPNTNYICITDNPHLKSKTWKIIVDTKNIDNSWSPRKKTYFVRYHPFNYCNSDYCYWIDSAIKILDVDFENISKNDLIYFHGIEIKTYIKDYILKWDVNLDTKYDYTNMYTKFISAKYTLDLLYKEVNKDLNKPFYHINGCFRGYKNSDFIKLKLIEIYEYLLKHVEYPENIEFHDDILYFDEGIAGVILDKIPANKLDFNTMLKNKNNMIFYNHNSFTERLI